MSAPNVPIQATTASRCSARRSTIARLGWALPVSSKLMGRAEESAPNAGSSWLTPSR